MALSPNAILTWLIILTVVLVIHIVLDAIHLKTVKTALKKKK